MTEFNDQFLKACRREATDHTPIWLMRQAGRYLPEYRELRQRHGMLEMCRTPELATRVTLMPLERFPFDAAILFSDITMPFFGMGVTFEIQEKIGPVVENPITTVADIDRLRRFSPEEELPFVLEAIRMLCRELRVPLIGFAGAPFTLAAYLIEGRPSREFARAREFMYREPEAWHRLMELLTDNTLDYLQAQVAAGAQALQIFDSWVGGLHPDIYREFLLPHMRRLFAGLADSGVPLVHFGTGTASLLELLREAGGDVIGIDWKTPLGAAWARLGDDVGVQGNLDPVLMSAPFDLVKPHVEAVLRECKGRHGHIFNLGHGVMPNASIDTVARLVDYVHEQSAR